MHLVKEVFDFITYTGSSQGQKDTMFGFGMRIVSTSLLADKRTCGSRLEDIFHNVIVLRLKMDSTYKLENGTTEEIITYMHLIHHGILNPPKT